VPWATVEFYSLSLLSLAYRTRLFSCFFFLHRQMELKQYNMRLEDVNPNLDSGIIISPTRIDEEFSIVSTLFRRTFFLIRGTLKSSILSEEHTIYSVFLG